MTGPVILTSKLLPPSPRSDAVALPDLVERLHRHAAGLTVVVAPTGWGKSHLVAEWISSSDIPVAYLGLDRSDNDPTRCWAHLLAAIAQAVSIEVSDLAAALRAPGLPVVSEIAEPLAARLDTHQLTVVLEDFHLITSAEVIESIEALIDVVPPGVGVTIVTRTEPPLHLPRRRVAGELSEVRVDDLRMDTTGAAHIVSDAIGRNLDDDLMQLLVDRTEGWAAGLYLAALSLGAADDARQFVESFAGDDRMISDYLSTEVLARADDDDRRFLLGTAVLTHLDADICDKLLNTSDSAVRLHDLSRTNLFLVASDPAGRTFRYHNLFSDWLRLEVQRHDPDQLKIDHERAAEIYADRNDYQLAVDHALAADAADLAYELVAKSGIALLDTGHHLTLARWCAQLPATTNPDQIGDLAVMRAWMGILDGDLDAVRRHCGAAQRVLNSAPWKSSFGVGDPGEFDLILAYADLLDGRFDEAASATAMARSMGVSTASEAALCYIEAATAYWLGDTDPNLFHTALSMSTERHSPYAELLSDGHLALIALDNHDPATAKRHVHAAFATGRRAGLESFGYSAICHLARAQLRLLDGEATLALQDAQRAAELAQRRSDLPMGCLAGIVIAGARYDLGDSSASDELRAVIADLAILPNPGILHERLHVTERQLRLPPSDRSARPNSLVEPLTDREMRLLRLLPGTLSQRELGDALHISFNTVKTHNRQIYRKLGVSSRDEAVTAAQAFGLI